MSPINLSSSLIHLRLTLPEEQPDPVSYCANRMQSTAKGLVSYDLPGSSLLNRPSNLFPSPHNTTDDEQFTIRIDGRLDHKHALFGQFIHSDTPAIREGAFSLRDNG
jgi:hypothetical protein